MKKSYIALFLTSVLFSANVCFAACEEGCRLEFKCVDTNSNDQEHNLIECFYGKGMYNIRTDEGLTGYKLEKLYEQNGIIEVPQYFSFSSSVGKTPYNILFKVIDAATDETVHSEYFASYYVMTYQNARENGKWKKCLPGEPETKCDM